jgi:hypothetical protein
MSSWCLKGPENNLIKSWRYVFSTLRLISAEIMIF